MANIALIYMSREGQSKKIAQRIKHKLIQAGYAVAKQSLLDLPESFSFSGYDAVILGCSVRYGKHHKVFRDFVTQHVQQLNHKPSFFFSVNLTARKPNRNQPHNNLYLKKYLASTQWEPNLVNVFAGALRYSQYTFFDKGMIRLIMKITGGPTDPKTDVEFTDWEQVDCYGEAIKKYLSNAMAANSDEAPIL
ncbi:MAG: menaquinone-dependent protoporphyrinogen IX dehydrogenase [Endozoicomonas sp. (ex Botrylloides leachii)]|nr:menaquinone-dependent protoporphyrinogen IX dehydrogenase [Endozoicomonas sp. (ex Botrylloides leachii)]